MLEGGFARFTASFGVVSIPVIMAENRHMNQILSPAEMLPSIDTPMPATVKPKPGTEQRGNARSASLFEHSPFRYSEQRVFPPIGNPEIEPRINAEAIEPLSLNSFPNIPENSFLHIEPNPDLDSIPDASMKGSNDGRIELNNRSSVFLT